MATPIDQSAVRQLDSVFLLAAPATVLMVEGGVILPQRSGAEGAVTLKAAAPVLAPHHEHGALPVEGATRCGLAANFSSVDVEVEGWGGFPHAFTTQVQ